MAVDLHTLFTPHAMAAVDARAIASGLDGPGLMARAGAAVAAEVLRAWPQALRAVVLVGPGNNGGDGHVAAGCLLRAGVPVIRCGLVPKAGTDAHRAFVRNPGPIEPLAAFKPKVGDVVIDALFGAGLDRPLDGEIANAIAAVAAAALPVIAVDLPSGLSGRTGRPTGPCLKADRTVTFAALKPGHLLLPGRMLCGPVLVADIGIPARLLVTNDPLWRNGPRVYGAARPALRPDAHKYVRGAAAVLAGPFSAGGAARLAAEAALRAGAGLVTLGVPRGSTLGYAAHLTAIMQRTVQDAAALADWLADGRLRAVAIGPGFGDPHRVRAFVEVLAQCSRPIVLDADALSAFAGEADELGRLFAGEMRLVITPHEGEFRRLFPVLADDPALSKVDRAREAALRLNAVVIDKGHDTVIAAPDGRAAIEADAPSSLATAGSGDVLTGIVCGLLAQGMPAFEAAAAGVALHALAAAGAGAGAGMTAEDLVACVGAWPSGSSDSPGHC